MILSIIIFSLLTLSFLIFFSKIAFKLGLVDRQDFRKIHQGAIPIVGGISIYIPILICCFFLQVPIQIFIAILFSSIIVITGLIDDIFELSVSLRITLQFLASLILIGSGLSIETLGDYHSYSVELGIFGLLLTFVSVITLTNAINFIDGIDGLSSSIVLVSLLTIFLFVKINNVNLNLDYIVIIFFIIFIFFLININLFPINKVFLGDSGSTFLGFMLSWILIYYTQKELNTLHPVLAIWCITLPCYDILRVIIVRLINKKNPMQPDRTHIHHIIMNLGFSSFSTLTIIIILSLLLNLFGGLMYFIFNSTLAVLSFIILFIIYFFSINYLKR